MLVNFFVQEPNKKRVYGQIHFITSEEQVLVTHPDPNIRNIVKTYLTTERTFVEMEDHEDEDIRGAIYKVTAVPTESEHRMRMALGEMRARTGGITVDWSHEDHRGPDSTRPKPENTYKSLFGDDEYDIIN